MSAVRAVVRYLFCAGGHEGPPEASYRSSVLPPRELVAMPCPLCGEPVEWRFEFMAEYYSRRRGKVPASGS